MRGWTDLSNQQGRLLLGLCNIGKVPVLAWVRELVLVRNHNHR